MQFIEQGTKGKTSIALFFITLAMVVLALVIGQIPVTIRLILSGLDLEHLDLAMAAEVIGKNTFLALNLLPFLIVLIVLLIAVKFIYKRPLRSLFTTRDSFDWSRFFVSFFIWGCASALILGVTYFVNGNMEWNINGDTFLGLLLVSLLLIPIQTTCEEVFFRGYLMQILHPYFKKPLFSILFSSVFFGLMHGANPEVAALGYGVLFYYIFTGLILALMTHFDDGLELSMGYHAINNIFAALIVTNEWQVFQTDALIMDHNVPSFGWEAILTMIIVQPTLLFIYAKIYKWNPCKQNLL